MFNSALGRLLEQFHRPSRSRTIRNRPTRMIGRQPVVEPLEDRLAPATVRWTNVAGGDWNTKSNWDAARVPVVNDDVVIDIAGITVTHSSGADLVNSLASSATFNLTGGSLQVSGSLTTMAPLQINASALSAGGVVAPTISVLNNGTLTGLASTATQMHKLDLQVTSTLTVNATSKIDVSGDGYLAGRTTGNTTAGVAPGFAGGSYGGLGGKSAGVGNMTYGDYADPNDWGSGAGAGSNGGVGGGLVRVTAGTLVLDGQVLANGTAGGGGGGSGGGIYVSVGTLSGAGRLTAKGADGTSISSIPGSGGGGGRIAVYAANFTTFDLAAISAPGGKDGGAGVLLGLANPPFKE